MHCADLPELSKPSAFDDEACRGELNHRITSAVNFSAMLDHYFCNQVQLFLGQYLLVEGEAHHCSLPSNLNITPLYACTLFTMPSRMKSATCSGSSARPPGMRWGGGGLSRSNRRRRTSRLIGVPSTQPGSTPHTVTSVSASSLAAHRTAML